MSSYDYQEWELINLRTKKKMPPIDTDTPGTEQKPTTASSPALQPVVDKDTTNPGDENSDHASTLKCNDTGETSHTSMYEHDAVYEPPPPRRIPRRSSISPVPLFRTRLSPAATLGSSAQLLDHVGYDGVVEIPYPSRSYIYLSTFPFTDRDVKKWSWLFALAKDNVWLGEGRGMRGSPDIDLFEDGEEYNAWYHDRGVRGRGPRSRRNDYDPVDIASVYLSRALDSTVVPENTANMAYYIVVKSVNRPVDSVKLLIAESRKAAGIMMFYEILAGNSIAFVGAVFGPVGKKAKKYKRVESIREGVAAAKREAFVAVIC